MKLSINSGSSEIRKPSLAQRLEAERNCWPQSGRLSFSNKLELDHVRTVSLASHKDYDQKVIVSVAKHKGWKQGDTVSNALTKSNRPTGSGSLA